MTTKPLTPINFNVSNSTPQSFQVPQSYSTSENEPPQTFSAPGSPDKLSPKHTLNSQGPRQALSPSSTYNPLMPQRANTENNDNQMMGLFDIYNKTEGCSVEEPAVSQSAKKGGNAGNFKRFVDDMKTEKRSLSAEKSYKCGTPVSKAIGLWAKENIPDASDKGTPGIKKKPRNSTEQVNRSVGGEAMIRFDNRKLKSTRRDVDSDTDTNGRYNTEEDRAEGLFDEDYFDKEAFMRDGPVRYSKMSEEDAATIFEIRRKELLSFLTKLGASSAVSKKKFVNKNVGGSRLGTANQNSDVGKNDFHREKGVRRLPDSLKENNSPTRFIIYNTTSDSNTLWNTNTSTQAGKFATPAKDKKVASAMKAGYESAPDEKRMREREELSPLVERNLEASFNQIVEWNDGMEKRSLVKVMKKTESTMKCYEEKVDAIENITIDLTKMAKLKKKKKKGSKKMKSEEEKWYTSEKVNVGKQVNEDVSFNQGHEQMEVKVQPQVQMQGQVESKVVQKNLEVIKKKNLSVMNEIADLDSQIERMRESNNRALLSYRRVEDERELSRKREESKRGLYDDGSHEGYLHAARMKKSAERSRSMSIKQLAVRENLKHNESMVENYSRGGLRNRDNIGEEDSGNQSRRNQKVRFADDLASSSKNSSQISQKEIKEKTLVRVPSQTNTSAANTVKVDLNKQNKTKAPTQKRALSNNTTSSRNVQQDTNLTLSTISSPKNAKDFQLKNLDLGRASAGLNHSFNVKTSQTTTNKSSEKIKFGGDLGGSRIKESQQPMQQLKTKKISRTSETNSTLPSVRESMLTSPKELTFSLRKTPVSCSTPIPVLKKELSNCAPAANNNKPVIKTKKPANKSISIKSNYRSVSDKDCSTEIPNLFEGSTPIHETASAAPKIFFSKEVKRIIRDGSKDEKPAVSKPKQAKSKEPVKTNKDTQSKVKKGEANRPDFDLNSSVSIRAKILRQSRPGQENLSFLKASASPSNLSDSSKLDMKPFALEDFGISPAASQVKKLPFKKSETDKNLLRKGSLSTPRGFKVVTSPTATTTRGCLGLSLQDMKEKLAEQACVEMDEDNESLDSFRLREKSLNLPLQPAQGKQQGQNGKGQESKETQAMKRKKAAGYSVC